MIPSALLVDSVLVETYSGDGAYGAVYASAVSVRCRIAASHKLVRGANGDQVVASAVLTVRPDKASLFTPESRVTIDGRESTVISVSTRSSLRSELAEVLCS